MEFDTIREAAEAWVREFNAIPIGVIEKLQRISNFDDIVEITPPKLYDRVCATEVNDGASELGEIVAVDGETYTIALDNGTTITCEDDEFVVEQHSDLPMWGTMWSFGDSLDDWWLDKDDGYDDSECNGLQKMANCGFRIFESEDYGYVFGIDGAGYDFYEEHWIPLYEARGLKWHKTGNDT